MVVSRQQMPPTKFKSRPPGTPTHKKRPTTTRPTTPPTCVAAPRGAGAGPCEEAAHPARRPARGMCGGQGGAGPTRRRRAPAPPRPPAGPTPCLCVSWYLLFFSWDYFVFFLFSRWSIFYPAAGQVHVRANSHSGRIGRHPNAPTHPAGTPPKETTKGPATKPKERKTRQSDPTNDPTAQTWRRDRQSHKKPPATASNTPLYMDQRRPTPLPSPPTPTAECRPRVAFCSKPGTTLIRESYESPLTAPPA